jgi:hypothetical protein
MKINNGLSFEKDNLAIRIINILKFLKSF